jgi:hypothetical protein
VCIIQTYILYFIRCCGAAAGIFNAWNRAQNTIYNLAQSPHREQQQHDHEQQQKDQKWRRFLLSDCSDYDTEDIIISIDDDVSAMSSSSSSSTLGEGTRSNNNDHNQKNPTTPVMKKEKQQEEKRNKVVSFRLSERDYPRHLSMAKLCYENGLTKGPDIVSYIRLSIECLWQYINNNFQARVQPSAEEKKEEKNRQQPQKKQEGGGVEQQQDVVDYHPMTASSPSRAAATAATTNIAAIGEQHTRESIARTPLPPLPIPPLFNLHEYFQPLFDQVDELNKRLDSIAEKENERWKEKKK